LEAVTGQGPGDPGEFEWIKHLDYVNELNKLLARADLMYQANEALSHERDARNLYRFISARLEEADPTPERELLRTVAGNSMRVATYFSCGRDQIVLSLAHLIQIAAGYRDHPDYQEAWKP
jgi:hypothetical protein